jgi:hypothetical protein
MRAQLGTGGRADAANLSTPLISSEYRSTTARCEGSLTAFGAVDWGVSAGEPSANAGHQSMPDQRSEVRECPLARSETLGVT